ncbi:surface antigen-like variable number repeat protein [Mariniflexile fucanivorans]|uniref:Surface antigen-like variable number repeat protein n=1 Tax=Mariniflexile fucanivorans TaxID=264023 RepID=A0A4R1RIZ3_9FLAO|nr:BamA/TamA family outer membrane protein [Mariniflexile fucanivorans]TCL66083.1 surface antigen-like variable number repeat protein [Mariniflexile fucanivorans]
MKLQFSKITLLVLITAQLISCDSVKRVPENEHLLTSNTVLINGKKDNTELINNLLYQEPNSRIPVVGTPLRLHVYNLARNNKDSLFEAWLDKTPNRRARLTKRLSKKQLDKLKESSVGFNNWLRKTGEAPVIVNEDKAKKSVDRLEAYYTNNGWFDVEANYSINKTDNKRADVVYNVETGVPFVLDTISEKIKSPLIDSIYQRTKNHTLVKHNEPYKSSNFSQERERISNELRNSGIYHFNQDYVTFEMDTIGTNKKVNVEVQIQNRAIRTQDSIKRVPFNIYKIKDVNIITDYSFENRGKPFQDSIFYKGYKIYGYNKIKYRPKALTDAVFINPNTVFKDSDRTLTYRHLNELRTFKYPNIDYIENENNTLTDSIRLTPLKKFSLGFSADASTSNIQTIGFSLNPSLLIRNVFRGAETFEISAITAIGSSQDKKENDPFFDINEIGADLKLTIPRFFFPFNTEKIIPKYMSPSTRISLATTSQTNIGLDKQTFTGIFNYNWQPSAKVTNSLNVFNIQYVRNLNIQNYFNVYENSYSSLNEVAQDVGYINSETDLEIPEGTDAFLSYVLADDTPSEISTTQLSTVNSINERKTRLTENNLILASSFSLTNDERTNLFDEDFSIFRFKLELAGNLLSSLSDAFGLKKNTDNRYELFNVAYSQYVKTELDYVKHWSLGNKNIIATRSYFGIAIPLGNSSNIPFSKSFFAGGANDNRAWTAYSLGPGSSESSNEFNEANLKLALSVEQRFNIFGSLNGAIFVDAGNIWNVLDDVTDENSTFTSFKSLKDIALGSGLGLRYDFSFFVFRFDIGFKTYDPSYQDQNRWFNDYNFSNAVYNIGINYPF